MPAIGDARRAAEQLFLRLHGLAEAGGGGQRRLTEEFEKDEVWEKGLRLELDALLSSFDQIKNQVETVEDRLAQVESTERGDQLLQEMRAVVRRLNSVSDGLNRTPARRQAGTRRSVDRAVGGQAAAHPAVRRSPRPGAGAPATAVRAPRNRRPDERHARGGRRIRLSRAAAGARDCAEPGHDPGDFLLAL
jgi:hypothetical protein